MNDSEDRPNDDTVQPSVQRIFISYAREDRQWAMERARVVRALGVDAFFDEDRIRAGDDWQETLHDEIEQADRVWVGWSKYAAQSEWVRREVAAARDKGPGALLIDLIDDTPLPPDLQHIQAERWTPGFRTRGDLIRDPHRDLPATDLRPTILLRPEYAVVPFAGREALIGDVWAWRASDHPFRARLYTGPGGAGKTRLFIEICRRLRAEHWQAGFLDREAFRETLRATPDKIDALLHPRMPTLLVVDYAETRREQVKALFRRALDKKTGPPVRVALLARSESDWWNELLGGSYDLQVLLGEGATPRPLPPLAADVDRQRLFEDAATAFTGLLERPAPPVPDLSTPGFDRVLFLHVAALAALLGETDTDPLALIDFILEHEARYWTRRADDLGLEERFQRTLGTAAALLTLAGGCASLNALADVLARHADLADASRLQRKEVARVFAGLYHAEDRIEPLQPDLLGERHVARAFRQDPALSAAWHAGAPADEIYHGLTVLNRAARHTPEAAGWLKEGLCRDTARLARPAIGVAVETGDPIGRILADCLEANPDPPLSAQLEPELPYPTVALRELAVVATTQALQTADEETARVRLLNNLSVKLRDLGRREDALKAADEATEIYRRLAQDRPDAFLPDLAMSLNNLGNSLSDLDGEDALKAADEATEIYRRLAQDRPDAFLPYLATSLNNLGTMLRDLGRREDALKAADEATEIYRRLAQDRPDAFLPDLAMSLNNLGTMLSDLGRREDALKAADEATAIRRRLAQDRPDAFLPDLAMSLNNLGTMLSDLGRREDALKAADEATEIYRRLAQDRPDAFLPYLAGSLNNLSVMLSDLGRREDALTANQEATEIYRRLAQDRPDAFLPDLATSLNNLGNRLSEVGRREDALKAADEATAIRRRLAQDRPDAFLPDLAMSLNNLGNRLRDLGRREDALKAADEATAIRRRLAQDRPDAFLPNLASSLNNLGTMLSDLGRREDALKAADEATEIYRRLAQDRPDAFLPYLATSLNNLGTMLSEVGRREDALKAADEATEIYRRLAQDRPDAFLPDLAMSLNNLGAMLRNLGRREDALKAADEATAIRRRLAQDRPDAFLPNLASSLNNLGTMLSDLGRREDALKAADEATEIYRRLAQDRPDAFLPDLAMSLNNLGNRLSDLGRREDALKAADEAVTVLLPFFRRFPEAFANWMGVMANNYIKRSEEAEQEPDAALLGEIAAIVETLNAPQ